MRLLTPVQMFQSVNVTSSRVHWDYCSLVKIWLFCSLIVNLCIGTVYSLCGVVPLTSFTSTLIPHSSFYPYSYSAATTAFLTCNLGGSFLSTLATKTLSKRTVLILTNLMMLVSTATLALYYHYQPCNYEGCLYCYVPITVCIIFFTSVGLGRSRYCKDAFDWLI